MFGRNLIKNVHGSSNEPRGVPCVLCHTSPFSQYELPLAKKHDVRGINRDIATSSLRRSSSTISSMTNLALTIDITKGLGFAKLLQFYSALGTNASKNEATPRY